MTLRNSVNFLYRIGEILKAFWGDKANRVSLLLMISLILFICHYQAPALKYVPLFQIGGFLLIFITGYLISSHWQEVRRVGLGPAQIWIPLAVISGSAIVRLFVQYNAETVAGALFMASMFGLYVVSRQYGEKTLNLFMPVVIIGVISIIVQAIILGQPKNPGIFNNYATAAEFLVFGWLVSPRKHQWWLSAVVLIGLLLSGAEEALAYISILGLVILIRKDWSRRILLPVGVIVAVFIFCFVTGFFSTLYFRASNMVHDLHSALTDPTLTSEQRDALLNQATNGRWSTGWRLHRPIEPLGYGVSITSYPLIPHNIVLLITDQLGPVAAIAWVSAMIAGIKATKRKYAFIALILFGLFQPFVWTEMAPYMWAMAGMATMAKGSSFIFKKDLAYVPNNALCLVT